eukprot:TRINITY_DN7256_c0_g1_i1.p1 TRINITY_DN7256_c0_g1~~TRINITY_DN7256_c0_g1_i1.p1  ORF type:complete len:1898 (+),score=531.76 TRINITY_DN7256_c0_g1_i1:79-5694(+)
MSVEACIRPVVAGTLREHEDPEERQRKFLFIPLGLISLIVAALWCIRYIVFFDEVGPLRLANQVVMVVLLCVSLSHAYLRRSLPRELCELPLTAFGLIYGVLNDLYGAGVHEFWLLAFLAVGGMLVAGARESVSTGLALVVVVWLIVRTTEDATRDLGLWDAVPYKNEEELIRPELGLWWGGMNGGLRVVVFVVNFLMSRYFVNGMRQRHRELQLAVRLAEEVAAAMVRFDLDTAAELVAQDTAESGALTEAFSELIKNLRMYRPYLPDGVLSGADAGSAQGDEYGSAVDSESLSSSSSGRLAAVGIDSGDQPDAIPCSVLTSPDNVKGLAIPGTPKKLGAPKVSVQAAAPGLTGALLLRNLGGRTPSSVSSKRGSGGSTRSGASARSTRSRRAPGARGSGAHLKLGLFRQTRAVLTASSPGQSQQRAQQQRQISDRTPERRLSRSLDAFARDREMTRASSATRISDGDAVEDMLSRQLCQWLERVVEASQQTQGMIESVSGTRVMVSAGPDRSARAARELGGPGGTAGAVNAALQTASLLLRPVPQQQGGSVHHDEDGGVLCGVAVGSALVGNLGTEQKRYRVLLGKPVEESEIMQSLAHHLSVACVTTEGAAKHAQRFGVFRLRPVERIVLRGRTCRGTPMLQPSASTVYHLSGRMDSGAALELYNAAWDALLDGETTQAASRMAQFCAEHPYDSVAAAVLARIQVFGDRPYITQLLPERHQLGDAEEPIQPAAPLAQGSLQLSSQDVGSGSEGGTPGSQPLQVDSAAPRAAASEARTVAYVVAQQPVCGEGGAAPPPPDPERLRTFARIATAAGGALERVGSDRLVARWEGPKAAARAGRCACRLALGGIPGVGVCSGDAYWSDPVYLGSGLCAASGPWTLALAKAEALAAAALAEGIPCVSDAQCTVGSLPSSVQQAQWRMLTPSAIFLLPTAGSEEGVAPTAPQALHGLSRRVPSLFYRRALQALESGCRKQATGPDDAEPEESQMDMEEVHGALLRACDMDDSDSWSRRLLHAVHDAQQSGRESILLQVTRAGVSFGGESDAQCKPSRPLATRANIKPAASTRGGFFSPKAKEKSGPSGFFSSSSAASSRMLGQRRGISNIRQGVTGGAKTSQQVPSGTPASPVQVSETATEAASPPARANAGPAAPSPPTNPLNPPTAIPEAVGRAVQIAEPCSPSTLPHGDPGCSEGEGGSEYEEEDALCLPGQGIDGQPDHTRRAWERRRELVQCCLGHLRPSSMGLEGTKLEEKRTVLQVAAKYWNILVLAAGMYNGLLIPARVVFDPKSSDSTALSTFIFGFNYIVDLVGWADIAFNFVEPYEEDGTEVSDPVRIMRHYLEGGFARDICMVFPWELSLGIAYGGGYLLDNHWVRFNRLLGIFTFRSLADNIEVEFTDMINPVVVQLARHLIEIAYIIWWLGCIWGAVFLHIGTEGELLEYLGYDIREMHPALKSMSGFHWALRAFAGYGMPRWPQTISEHAVALGVSVIGVAIFATLLAHVQRLLDVMNSGQQAYSNKIDECFEFFSYHRITADEAQPVRKYFSVLWARTRQASHGQHTEVLEQLPPALFGEFYFYANLDAVPLVPELRAITNAQLLVTVVSSMEHWVMPPGERLFNRGDDTHGIIFLSRGEAVATITSALGGEIFVERLAGQQRATSEQEGLCPFWGEIAFFFPGLQMATVCAVGYMEMFTLDFGGFNCIDGKWLVPFEEKARARRERMRELIAADGQAGVEGTGPAIQVGQLTPHIGLPAAESSDDFWRTPTSPRGRLLPRSASSQSGTGSHSRLSSGLSGSRSAAAQSPHRGDGQSPVPRHRRGSSPSAPMRQDAPVTPVQRAGNPPRTAGSSPAEGALSAGRRPSARRRASEGWSL